MRLPRYPFKTGFFLILAILAIGCFQHWAPVKDLPTMHVTAQEMKASKRPTTIEVSYPTENLSTDKAEVGLVAMVYAGEPVRTVTISVNERQLQRLNIDDQGDGFRSQIPIEVSAPLVMGMNTITISATPNQGEGIHKTVTVKRVNPVETTSSKPIGKRWAVVIGISEYLHASSGITPLKFPHRDAIEFMNFLHSPQGGGFNPANTRLLINEQATTRKIRSALFTFLKQAKKDDLVLVYFAGHGAPEPGRPANLYLITYDSDPEDLASTAFPMWDMETALKRYIAAERVVVIADACHSAGVSGEAGLRSVGNSNLINTYLVNLEKTKPGRVIITASETNELSREGDEWDRHGVFTYFLLKGLAGEADDDDNGVVTVSEAFHYVHNKVRRATNSQQHPNIQGRFDNNLPLAVIK
jgi:hypothetical protein